MKFQHNISQNISVGNDIKWIKRSKVHQKVLEDLVKKLKYKPYAVKTIGVYKVCFEDDFRIGYGSNDTEVFVGLGTDGVEVAIKRLKSDFSYLGENEKSMMNSQRLKDDPNVLTYRFHTEGRQYVYLITNLEEESLNQFVRSKDRSLVELQKKGPTILKQILLGIDALHDENILHRDLKPENVLVNFEGTMVLADFGICRRLQPGQTTHWSTVRGTESWRALESLPNSDDDSALPDEIRVRYKKKSDVQVLGMIFYFVLTRGKHPFGKQEIYRPGNISKGESNLIDLTDPVAKDLIQWMLQHNITQRATVKECLKHPYLMLPEENFKFLTAVGNEVEIKTKDKNSIVVQMLSQETSLATPAWWEKIDGDVFSYFSRSRTYTSNPADLLRFMRNVEQHSNDKVLPPSVQLKFGTPHAYFLKAFPILPMLVHKIIREHQPDWCQRKTLKQFF
jgi:serine/threonine-protein kinase/endoribonuclease IRE1